MDPRLEADPETLPTARPFVGRTVVIRLDSQTAESATLAEDLIFMRRLGVRPMVVHGADQSASGSRLVGLINRVGGEAVAIDGTSASTLVLARDSIGAYSVRSVNAHLLSLLMDQGYIPVFGAQGACVSGATAILDAAEAARALAAATHAVRLLYPSETGGIPAGSDGIIDELTSSEALSLVAAGALSPELTKYVTAAAMGVRHGVEAAQLLDLNAAHAAIVELLTAQHLGTQIKSNIVLSS